MAVLGLESMRDLASLRDAYGFDRVEAIPELHAAEVSVDPAQLRSLLANAPGDPPDPLRGAGWPATPEPGLAERSTAADGESGDQPSL